MLKSLVGALCAGFVLVGGALAQQPTVAQYRIVIAGGADVTGMNALDVIVIVPDRSLMEHIGDTLLRWEAPGKVGPWLATDWKLLDPVTWELKLRKGVKFQDSEDFTAKTVKFLYDTMNDPKTVAPSKTHHTFVKQVQIVDDHTVRIITKSPYPVAPNQLALGHMMPQEYVKKVGLDGYRPRPTGTGDYRFNEQVMDDHLTLEAFDGFWGGPQKIKTIIYRPIKEDAARGAALMTGEIDLALDIQPEMIPTFESNPKVQIKQVLSGRTFIIILNELDPKLPTAMREVREAISIAIDRESLDTNILQGAGDAAAWLRPKTNGFNPDLKPLPYDPGRAKRFPAEAGYQNGLEVILDSPDGNYNKDKEMAEAIAGQREKAGFRGTVKTNDWGLLTRRISSHQVGAMTLVGWGDTNGDPEARNRLAVQSGATWSHTKDPKLDDLFARMPREMDPDKRKALLFEQQDYTRTTFLMVYVVQMGIIVGAPQKLDWYQPRLDERYCFFNVQRGWCEIMAQMLSGRRILRTCGASGIGRATAELFAEEGACVAVVDVNADAAADVAHKLNGVSFAADVSREADVEVAVNGAAEALGGLDGPVNSAGVSFRYTVRDAPIERWRRVFDINLTGPFSVCHFAIPFLACDEKSTIVNVSSGTALRAVGGRSGYMAAQSGLIVFTKSPPQELGPKIRVNVYCPGLVDTPLFRSNLAVLSMIESTGKGVALQRVGAIDEMAQTIHFLTSDQSSFVTGSMFMAEGGGKHAMM